MSAAEHIISMIIWVSQSILMLFHEQTVFYLTLRQQKLLNCNETLIQKVNNISMQNTITAMGCLKSVFRNIYMYLK